MFQKKMLPSRTQHLRRSCAQHCALPAWRGRRSSWIYASNFNRGQDLPIPKHPCRRSMQWWIFGAVLLSFADLDCMGLHRSGWIRTMQRTTSRIMRLLLRRWSNKWAQVPFYKECVVFPHDRRLLVPWRHPGRSVPRIGTHLEMVYPSINSFSYSAYSIAHLRNEYRPVLGENSWASLIGALQFEYIKSGHNVANIAEDSLGSYKSRWKYFCST